MLMLMMKRRIGFDAGGIGAVENIGIVEDTGVVVALLRFENVVRFEDDESAATEEAGAGAGSGSGQTTWLFLSVESCGRK